jgi:aminomethyltransferase
MAAALQPAAVPTSNPDSAAQLSALLTGAAITPLDSVGWIRVTGSDRVRWLNGMVTNDIQSLQPGEGCYNFVLNAQGRIQGDLTAFALPDSLLLETADAGKLATWFDHYIIMDDVELTVLRNGRGERESAAAGGYPFLAEASDRAGVSLVGPRAAAILQSLDFPVGQLPTLRLQCATWNNASLDIIHGHSPLVPSIELWSDQSTIQKLTAKITAADATAVTPSALEYLRILSGTPRYRVDIRNTDAAHDLPQETGQTRALHFAKGCYLGQEIVERIRSRGSVHRTFHGFELTGALPAPGAPLTAESSPRPVGELTSVAAIPLPESAAAPARTIQLALGYVRREALADAQARALTLEYPGGGIATPIAMPYPIP